MSVSREWTSLKIAWTVLFLALAVRIYLSGQFLLTPDEALFWHTSIFPHPDASVISPVLAWMTRLSTTLFGNNETAVRLPSIIALTVAAIYIALIASSMFSWHTGLHVTLLTQGILQLNLAALILSPYSLLLLCWAAVCYHASQAMHRNETGGWLLAGFWFGIGLLCDMSILLLLPCLMLCFVLIKPFRTCLLFPGPWFGFILSMAIFVPVAYWLKIPELNVFTNTSYLMNMFLDLVPDVHHSLQFLIDQLVVVTPVVLLLIISCWLSGSNKRHLVKPDVQFLIFTSLPIFLLYLIFPVFSDSGNIWSATAYISAFPLIAGVYSSTRSNFKGRPTLRWLVGVLTAYVITIPLILQIAYPSIPVSSRQTRMATTGWDALGREADISLNRMPNPEKTFIFSMEPKITGEFAFYTPESHKTVSLDHATRSNNRDYLVKEMQLGGEDAIGLVSTRAAIEQARTLFAQVDLEREVTIPLSGSDEPGQIRTFYIIRCFSFRLGV